jgi:hypothetical protein
MRRYLYLLLTLCVIPSLWGGPLVSITDPVTGRSTDDSLNLRYVGSWPFGPADPIAVDSAQNLLFLGSGGGVLVLDVTNPSQPQRVSDGIRISGSVLGLSYDPALTRLYVAAQTAGLDIWDVSRPAQPTRLGNLGGSFQDVSVAGTLAYLADAVGLLIADISDPAHPFPVGATDTAMVTPRAVVVQGNHAFLAADETALWIVDIRDPARPTEAGRCTTSSWGTDVMLRDSIALVTSNSDGLLAFDVGNPADPVLLCREASSPNNRALAVQGSLAFVASGEGLRVFDVSDPAHLRAVGQADPAYAMNDIAVVAARAWLTRGASGLTCYDISDPTGLVAEIGSYVPTDDVAGIALDTPYVYLCVPDSGLAVIDARDPAHPERVGTCSLPGALVRQVVLSGNHACVLSRYLLRLVNVEDPGNPFLVGSCSLPGRGENVSARDGIACVADLYDGLRIIDVRDPANPVEVGSLELDYAQDVAQTPGYAWVLHDDEFLTAVDISNPAQPQLIAACTLDYGAFVLTVAGNYAYAASEAIQIIDISNPRSPVPVGVIETQSTPLDIWVSGTALLVATEEGQLLIADVANPALPRLLQVVTLPDEMEGTGVVASGIHAYAAASYAGLRVYDFSDTGGPFALGTFATPGHALDVDHAGNYVYVAADDDGLRIFDVSDPALPQEVGMCAPSFDLRAVCVQGGYAHIADATGLDVIDVSDPQHPVLTGSLALPRDAEGIALADTFAFVADAGNGLYIVNVANPAAPAIVGNIDTYRAQGVAVQGNCAFVADASRGLKTVDVSNPAAPVLLDTFDTGNAYGVAVEGNYAYVADRTNGLVIVNISDPANLSLAGDLDLGDDGYNVTLQYPYAYVGANNRGLAVVDVRDTAAPILAGYYDTPGRARGIALSNRHVFVADYSRGLQIYEFLLSGAAERPKALPRQCALRLLRNPARGALQLRLSIPNATLVRFELFDAAGRLAQHYETPRLAAGDHGLRLPINDLSPGAYFLRTSQPAGPGNIKVIIAR